MNTDEMANCGDEQNTATKHRVYYGHCPGPGPQHRVGLTVIESNIADIIA